MHTVPLEAVSKWKNSDDKTCGQGLKLLQPIHIVIDLDHCYKGYDDTRMNSDHKEANRDFEFDEGFGDDVMEKELSSDIGDIPVITAWKETKRALEFEHELNETGTVNMNVKEDGVRKQSMTRWMRRKRRKRD